MMLILSNRQYFRGVDAAYTSNTQYFRGVDAAYIKQYTIFSGGRCYLY